MAIFTNILRIMENKKVTQKQMAECLGVTEQKISDWKAGRLKSYTKHLNKMAECLGVSVDELLGNKNKPTDELGELKEALLGIMEGLSQEEILKLLDHAELLEAARRNQSTQ